MTSVLDTQFKVSTLLDFNCEVKDMDERTADLMEKARQIWELCLNEMEFNQYTEKEKALDGCYEKTVCAIQVITGIAEWDATHLTDILIKQYRSKENV